MTIWGRNGRVWSGLRRLARSPDPSADDESVTRGAPSGQFEHESTSRFVRGFVQPAGRALARRDVLHDRDHRTMLVEPDKVQREAHTRHPDRMPTDLRPFQKKSVNIEAVAPCEPTGARRGCICDLYADAPAGRDQSGAGHFLRPGQDRSGERRNDRWRHHHQPCVAGLQPSLVRDAGYRRLRARQAARHRYSPATRARIHPEISSSTHATTFAEIWWCRGNCPRCSRRQIVDLDRPVRSRTAGNRSSRGGVAGPRATASPASTGSGRLTPCPPNSARPRALMTPFARSGSVAMAASGAFDTTTPSSTQAIEHASCHRL
jgi:hypothetical protein